MSTDDPQALRESMAESWERAATGWGKRAHDIRSWGMPVSHAMIERLALGPGQRVLELAAGPGDTGFLAAELVTPGGGSLICSDASEAMLEVARERAATLGINGVEFRQLELEWIDLPTADVDRIVCRWGVMLTVDPEACLRECRRVLRVGGRIALAVWDAAERNPWATIPTEALVELGHLPPPDRGGPGMFSLAAPGRLAEMMEDAGLTGVGVEAIPVPRPYAGIDGYLAETLDLSPTFGPTLQRLSSDEREQVRQRIETLTDPFRDAEGGLELPGSSLVADAVA